MNPYTQEPWFEALKREVDRTSQAQAADRIGVNKAYVSLVLSGRDFPGRIDRFIASVEGALLHQTVMCPVTGEISKHLCQQHQAQPWSNVNPMRVRLFRACRNGCPHSTLGKPTC